MFVGKLLSSAPLVYGRDKVFCCCDENAKPAALLVNSKIHRSCDARGRVGRNHLELNKVR